MTKVAPILSVVVPCYNEEEVLPETARRLADLLCRLSADGLVDPASHVTFVDDGSRDKTWSIICNLISDYACFGGLRLSRNRGHQNALMAGLLSAEGDVVVSVDADLQDDLNAMVEMLHAVSGGADIVYGVRSARTTDTPLKRQTAQLYYRLLHLLNVDIIYNHADYRLLSRRAIEALRQYGESNLFLRALIPQLGFATKIVTYERAERFAGESKYPFTKMVALALEGVTSFSTRPLRLVTYLGGMTSVFSLTLTIWALFTALVLKRAIPGWASTVVPIYLICGVQLLSLGVIGEYVGKIYMETKRRPLFHVAEHVQPRATMRHSAPANAASRSSEMTLSSSFASVAN